ncbi:MAG: HD domain-containing phosphohydrolase [Chloroflexota bacterium]
MTNNNHEEKIEKLFRLNKQIQSSVGSGSTEREDVSQYFDQVNDQLNAVDSQFAQILEERDGLKTLAEIGESLTSTLDSNAILENVLDSIIRLAKAERCFMMLLGSDGSTQVQIGRNWKHETLTPQEQAISKTIVKEVIQKKAPVLTTNAETDPRFDATESVMNFKLRSVMCVPMIYQQSLLGVIYADHRLRSEQFSNAKIELLSKFANQSAIALRNATLYENLQQTHMKLKIAHNELEEAYDTTLEGWAKALELRDQSTEEHTKRVVSQCVQLAERMGIPPDDIVQIRRGSILHDIGKMGIPDEVLGKPGALTEDEIEIMRQHPLLAVKMLSRIKFLSGALEIPMFHHERWDGDGYPHRLKGEEIPLSARIFAVIDVWDAITSERPYRKALPEKKAIAHIQDGAGNHFDPKVVTAFLEMIQEGGETEK